MRLQPFRIGIALLGPTRAEQRASFEHFTRARDERGEKTELSRRQIERITVDARDVRLRIQAQATYGRRGLRGGCGCGAAEQRAHARAKLLRAERLFEIVIGAEIEQLRTLVRAALAGEHEDRRRRDRADPLAHLVTGEARELAIQDHEIRRFVRVTTQCRLAVVRGDHLVAVLAEQRRDHPDEGALVVDDEDAAQRDAAEAVSGASGSENAKTAPPSGASSTQISPPCASTTRRDANRPMPDPGTSSLPAPRAYGSKIRDRSFGGTPRP